MIIFVIVEKILKDVIYRTDSSTVLPLALKHARVTTCAHSLELQKRECRMSLRASVLGFCVVNF